MHPLSIIIPHFQKQKALERTWEELQLQINLEDRILIVDDHSPNGVPDFDCQCTKVIKPPKHLPHIYRLNTLRNYGLSNSPHDFCVLLDPDCIPNPRFLDYARKMCDSSVLFGGCIDNMQEDGSIKLDNRRNSGKSYWCDLRDKGGAGIFGGSMLFSKSRTKLVGWFDEEYNNSWGYGEHDFAAKCYQSGMRLRFSMELQVTHQWHPPHLEGYEENKKLYFTKLESYRNHLGRFTPYNPAVAVLMVSLMRPYYIEQNMRALFRSLIPLKVMLVNNGDTSEEQRNEMSVWSKRWAVDYVNNPSRKLLADIRIEAMNHYHGKNYKYLMMVDDDIMPMNGSIESLISEMENHEDYHALSGYVVEQRGSRFIGGRIENNNYYYYTPVREGVFEADYISSGFTIVRLDKVVPYPEGWEMGWNDWCWSKEVTSRGLKVGVTGKAGAYHRLLFTAQGKIWKQDSEEYNKIRYDEDRHDRMAEQFRKRWGYIPNRTKVKK